MSGLRALRAVAYVSAAYDTVLAVPLLLIPVATAGLFGLADPVPVINAQLNGGFALALAVGYLWAARAPLDRAGYFWAAGVLAKGLGAVLFVLDHVIRSSPRMLLVFALTDGTLALVTLMALVSVRAQRRRDDRVL